MKGGPPSERPNSVRQFGYGARKSMLDINKSHDLEFSPTTER